MNKKMPGFGAGASLYRTSGHYQMAQGIATSSSERTVVPQQEMSLQPRDTAGAQRTAGAGQRPSVSCWCPCCICGDWWCVCC
jgi:hypothetical protein